MFQCQLVQLKVGYLEGARYLPAMFQCQLVQLKAKREMVIIGMNLVPMPIGSIKGLAQLNNKVDKVGSNANWFN